jgi:Protein of unknown function (DUF3443)
VSDGGAYRRAPRSHRWLVSAVFCLSGSVGVLPFVAGRAAAASAAAIAVVPVTVQGGQGTSGGADPVVNVRVGGSKSVPVYLDTGSSGLHIFANAVSTGSGVTVSSQKSDITYEGGSKFVGVVASAVVTIGSQATAAPVSFALVNDIRCTAAKPACAAAGGISGYESSKGAYGILGIGMQSSQGGVTSPLLGMPGGLADSWSLALHGTTGRLVLGAAASLGRRAAPTTFQLKSAGTVAGRPLWRDDRVPLCLSVGTVQQCTHGLFDSGTGSFQISGPVLGQAPTVAGSQQVVAGLAVTVTEPGVAAPFWTFTTGTTKSEDLMRIGPESGSFVNTGVQVFYDFRVLYNDTAGTISLYPV